MLYYLATHLRLFFFLIQRLSECEYVSVLNVLGFVLLLVYHHSATMLAEHSNHLRLSTTK